MSYLELHESEIFKKHNNEQLLKDIASYRNGEGRLSKVLNHWFEECIYACQTKYEKSPIKALQNDTDMEWILNYIKSKPKFYNSNNEITNVKSFFRNGTRIARKVANFCPKNARDIYFRYNDINGERINCLTQSLVLAVE